MNLLTAHKVTVSYGSHTVLKDLSLDIESGRVLVILGPNGCGKTTLLRALARQVPIQSGVIQYEGGDVWEISAKQFAQRVAISPQSEHRDWPLSVAEAVMLGRFAHAAWLSPYSQLDHDVVLRVIDQFGLQDLLDRPITELSGGEWRRVILARTLAQEPQVLLLDEPTTGLDLKYQLELLTTARSLAHESGLAVVLTMHDLNLAAAYADDVAILQSGEVAAFGQPEAVLTDEMVKRVFEVEVQQVTAPNSDRPIIIPRR